MYLFICIIPSSKSRIFPPWDFQLDEDQDHTTSERGRWMRVSKEGEQWAVYLQFVFSEDFCASFFFKTYMLFLIYIYPKDHYQKHPKYIPKKKPHTQNPTDHLKTARSTDGPTESVGAETRHGMASSRWLDETSCGLGAEGSGCFWAWTWCIRTSCGKMW